jgi:hypothetical protein
MHKESTGSADGFFISDRLKLKEKINPMTAMALVPATAFSYHSNLNLLLPLSCKVFLCRIPHSDIFYPVGSFWLISLYFELTPVDTTS